MKRGDQIFGLVGNLVNVLSRAYSPRSTLALDLYDDIAVDEFDFQRPTVPPAHDCEVVLKGRGLLTATST